MATPKQTPKQATLETFFHDTYRIYHPKLRSANSVCQYVSVCRVIDRFHRRTAPGPVTTQDLSPELILGAAADLVNSQGRSAATANRVIRTAIAMWREAARRGYAPDLPKEPLPTYSEPKRNPVCWSGDEFAAALKATQAEPGYIGPVPASSWLLALQLFVFWTGARISAVMSVRTEAMDFTAGTVKIDAEAQKHRADGLYDLPADLVALIDSFGVRSRGLETVFGDWIFDRSQTGWRALNRRLARVLVRAGLPATRRDKWHKIRRTFATQVCAARGIGVAQSMLGHSNQKVTAAYIDPRFIPRDRATEILVAPSVPLVPQFRVVG